MILVTIPLPIILIEEFADNAFTTTINNNTMDVNQDGIRAESGTSLTINNNIINDFEEHGINFIILLLVFNNYNRIISTHNNGDWKVGIKNGYSNQNAVVNYNYIETSDSSSMSYICQR